MKALRQDIKKAKRNAKVKKDVKGLIKSTKKALGLKDKTSATDRIKKAIKAIDKAVQNKVLKKNTGARKKSRLMKGLNKLGK